MYNKSRKIKKALFFFSIENALKRPWAFLSSSIKAVLRRRVKDTNQPRRRLGVYFDAKLRTYCDVPTARLVQLPSLQLDRILKHLAEQKAAPREVLLCDHVSL